MNEAEQDHIEYKQSLSYDWIHRNYHMKQKSFCWEWVQSCYDVSYVLYKSHMKERRETEEDWGVLDQHDQYQKSLNLTKEDWSENYTLWLLSWVFKCVQLYDDWEIAALKRRRHRSSNWTRRGEQKRIKSILRFSIQHNKREATNVAKNINRTFEQVVHMSQ